MRTFACATCLLAACTAVPAVDPDETSPDAFDQDEKADDASLATVYDDGQVRVLSDLALDANTAAGYARMLETAYQFDLDRLQWTHPPLLSDQILILKALSPDRMAADYPGLAGGAFGGSSIVMSTDTLGRAGAPGVIAHEASHIQSKRGGGGLPHALEEGKAGELQRMYLRQLGITYKAPAIVSEATAGQAQQALDGFMYGPETALGTNEPLGLMFSEFLRVDEGFGAAMFPCIAGTIEQMAVLRAQGETESLTIFRIAFHQVYGMWFADARQAYLDFMSSTEGDAATRLAGTIIPPS